MHKVFKNIPSRLKLFNGIKGKIFKRNEYSCFHHINRGILLFLLQFQEMNNVLYHSLDSNLLVYSFYIDNFISKRQLLQNRQIREIHHLHTRKIQVDFQYCKYTFKPLTLQVEYF